MQGEPGNGTLIMDPDGGQLSLKEGPTVRGTSRGGALDLNPHPSPAQNVQNVSHLHPEPMPLNPGHPGRSGGGCANEMNFP